MKINNHPSKETREKMSRAHKGKHISPAVKKKMSETMRAKTELMNKKLVELLPAFPVNTNGEKLSEEKASELIKMLRREIKRKQKENGEKR